MIRHSGRYLDRARLCNIFVSGMTRWRKNGKLLIEMSFEVRILIHMKADQQPGLTNFTSLVVLRTFLLRENKISRMKRFTFIDLL